MDLNDYQSYFGQNDGRSFCQNVVSPTDTNTATLSTIVRVFASTSCEEDSHQWDVNLDQFDGGEWTVNAIVEPFLTTSVYTD